MKKNILVILFCYSSMVFAHSPELATGRTQQALVHGKQSMVVTNNFWATQAAQEILAAGGNAIDAAIAAGFVLGLTEPQSSGIGGGGYALAYSAKKKNLVAYDGREVAPASATPSLFLLANGQPMDFKAAMLSPKSIGVPGEVALFYQLHAQQGKLPWARLLQPAIDLATKGFPLSLRLHAILVADKALLIGDPTLKETYFINNEVKPVGALIKNLDYATTLKILATNPKSFYQGKLADELIQAINSSAKAKLFSSTDFSNYRVKVYPPLCASYRKQYQICSVPPSTSGGVTLLELLGIYSRRYQGTDYANSEWSYYFLEAGKLAYADRDQYSADPEFIKQPVLGLLADSYLNTRSQLITDLALKMPVAAGIPDGIDNQYAPDNCAKPKGTTSLVIVDKEGNAISMTISIEHQLGNHLYIHGFFLNNQLTDFSFIPANARGQLIANRVTPGKRPRSSMAPTLVFKDNNLYALSGSPGGSEIICYVAKNLILMLDMHLTPDKASASPNLCGNSTNTLIDGISVKDKNFLEKKGEVLQTTDLVSGVTNIIRDEERGWLGAADPRREGVSSPE